MKKLPLILALQFFSFLATAQIKKTDFTFSVEPLFGLKNGIVDEYVYLKNCSYSDDKLSELNWDIKNELYGGIKLNGSFKNIFLETSFTAAIPKSSGITKDSDWKNVSAEGYSDWQFKTNYSETDNYIDYDIGTKVKAGYEFKLLQDKKIKLSLKPFAEFQYENFQFTTKDGTAWYGNTKISNLLWYRYNDSEHNSIFKFSSLSKYNGKTISYQRQNLIFWLGSDFKIELPENFTVLAGFKVSPYIYSESVDTHYLNDPYGRTSYSSYYLDVTPGYFSVFGASLGVEYALTKKQSFILGAEGFYMKTLRGNDYSTVRQTKPNWKEWKDIAKKQKSYVDGGAAQRYINITFAYKYKFL